MARFSFVRHVWFLTLVSGVVLFLITEKVLRYTDNPNYFPTVIMLGAFLVPVTFVIFVYERAQVSTVPPGLLGLTMLWGGAIGTIVAGILEFETVSNMSLLPLLTIGTIEESAKLILPVGFFIAGRYRKETEGLVFGAAAGMGFAALETMGYGFVALLKSQGNVGVLEDTLLLRGLLAPVGHGAWTAAICGVLWRERAVGHSMLVRVRNVASAFVIVVLLHAAWDGFAGAGGSNLVQWAGVELSTLVIAALSLIFFVRRMREAIRANTPLPISPSG